MPASAQSWSDSFLFVIFFIIPDSVQNFNPQIPLPRTAIHGNISYSFPTAPGDPRTAVQGEALNIPQKPHSQYRLGKSEGPGSPKHPRLFFLFSPIFSTISFDKSAGTWRITPCACGFFHLPCSAIGCKLSSSIVRKSRSSRLFPPDK